MSAMHRAQNRDSGFTCQQCGQTVKSGPAGGKLMLEWILDSGSWILDGPDDLRSG